jgi:hypothetical protein
MRILNSQSESYLTKTRPEHGIQAAKNSHTMNHKVEPKFDRLHVAFEQCGPVDGHHNAREQQRSGKRQQRELVQEIKSFGLAERAIWQFVIWHASTYTIVVTQNNILPLVTPYTADCMTVALVLRSNLLKLKERSRGIKNNSAIRFAYINKY